MSDNFDYRAEQQKLEDIVSSMQAGDLTIDESLEQYKQAETIIKNLEKYLKTAENKIKKIKPSG